MYLQMTHNSTAAFVSTGAVESFEEACAYHYRAAVPC